MAKKTELSKIKLFITDIDGVMTDAGMYYTENGDELKKFSTYDGMGLKMLMKLGVKTGIITGEDRLLNKKRAEKIGVDYLYQGIADKLNTASLLCKKIGVSLSEVAYIGDDINDLELLEACGIAACPANAMKSVKAIPNIIHLEKKGGDGAVREFIELLIERNLV
jgi:3-deoxy-D-manno-octulosonate 8-phosphate phosphatase (KDO 8-P phosphatase)